MFWKLNDLLCKYFSLILKNERNNCFSHSYTASENVLVAPRDGKFQTLCQSYHQCKGIFFHAMVVDHHGKGFFFPGQ